MATYSNVRQAHTEASDEFLSGAVMTRVFLSYRRDDSRHITGRIHDRLRDQLGEKNVFQDVDSIPLGTDFRQKLQQALGQCQFFVAVIGPNWLEARHDGKRRLDLEDDYVRQEIEGALTRKIPVIPVLVDGARLPKAEELPPSLKNLSFRQATSIGTDHFDQDMIPLLKALAKTRPWKVILKLFLALAFLAGASWLIYYYFLRTGDMLLIPRDSFVEREERQDAFEVNFSLANKTDSQIFLNKIVFSLGQLTETVEKVPVTGSVNPQQILEVSKFDDQIGAKLDFHEGIAKLQALPIQKSARPLGRGNRTFQVFEKNRLVFGPKHVADFQLKVAIDRPSHGVLKKSVNLQLAYRINVYYDDAQLQQRSIQANGSFPIGPQWEGATLRSPGVKYDAPETPIDLLVKPRP